MGTIPLMTRALLSDGLVDPEGGGVLVFHLVTPVPPASLRVADVRRARAHGLGQVTLAASLNFRSFPELPPLGSGGP